MVVPHRRRCPYCEVKLTNDHFIVSFNFLGLTAFDDISLAMIRLTRLQTQAQELGPQSQSVDSHIANSRFERIPIQLRGAKGIAL